MHQIKLVPGVALVFLLTFTGASSMSTITCDDHNVHRMSCDYGVILLKDAMYGRKDSEPCPSAGVRALPNPHTTCSQTGTKELIKSRCDGKKKYELNMKELHTSDPCPTVSKYLETDYICVRATHKTICEGSTVQIKCGRRQLISILGAYFGRQDKKTCSKGRPESEIQNCDCSKSVTDIVAHKCNEENSCIIEVSTKVLTDPCTGTYKYLELAYECQSKKTSP